MIPVSVDRNVRPVPLEGISDVGGVALKLQGLVERVYSEFDIPVGSGHLE